MTAGGFVRETLRNGTKDQVAHLSLAIADYRVVEYSNDFAHAILSRTIALALKKVCESIAVQPDVRLDNVADLVAALGSGSNECERLLPDVIPSEAK